MEPLSLADNIFNESSGEAPVNRAESPNSNALVKQQEFESLFRNKSYIFFKLPVTTVMSSMVVRGITRIGTSGSRYYLSAPFGEGELSFIAAEIFARSGGRHAQFYDRVRRRLSIDLAVKSAMAVMVTLTPEKVGESIAHSLKYKVMSGFDTCLTAYDSSNGFIISGLYPKK